MGKQQSGGWLSRLVAGDHQAFAEFVDRYKDMVFLCCRTLGLREQEAEDVASDTFLSAYKGLKQYRGQAELSTWLWRIAYRQGVNYLRKNRSQMQLLVEPGTEVGRIKEAGPAAAAHRREKEEIVWKAVKKLPRLWALAIILYHREQKSIADVAQIMRIRQNTVKTYLFRGRKKLKVLLADVLGEDIDAGG